jgi:hypothetical protein
MDRKKIVIAVAVLFILLLGGAGAYFYFNKPAQPTPANGVPFPGNGNLIPPKPPTGNTENPDDGIFPPSAETSSRLYELHKTPVAGIGFADQTVGKKKIFFVRLIERSLGHLFETNLETLSEARISSETYIGIAEAFFGNNGRNVIIRSLDEQDGIAIKTRSLTLSEPIIAFTPKTEGSGNQGAVSVVTPEETLLPDYIPHLAVAEDAANKIFYLENGLTSARGTAANFKGSGVSVIFNSAFTEWLPQLPNQKLATITTKPSGNVPGHLFFINTENSVLTKILGNIKGLTTTTNRDGKFVLYAETKAETPSLFSYDVLKKESRPLSLNTFAEKCGWSSKDPFIAYCAVPKTIPRGTYPDQWYQGTASFADDVWKINVKTGAGEKILIPENYGVSAMDIISPMVSSDETYLIFINKKSSTPWLFLLVEQPKIVVPAKIN